MHRLSPLHSRAESYHDCIVDISVIPLILLSSFERLCNKCKLISVCSHRRSLSDQDKISYERENFEQSGTPLSRALWFEEFLVYALLIAVMDCHLCMGLVFTSYPSSIMCPYCYLGTRVTSTLYVVDCGKPTTNPKFNHTAQCHCPAVECLSRDLCAS